MLTVLNMTLLPAGSEKTRTNLIDWLWGADIVILCGFDFGIRDGIFWRSFVAYCALVGVGIESEVHQVLYKVNNKF
jgi:hypothetical protein